MSLHAGEIIIILDLKINKRFFIVQLKFIKEERVDRTKRIRKSIFPTADSIRKGKHKEIDATVKR